MSDVLLRVEALHAGYGDLKVLVDVGLTAQSGQVLTVLGANGAGKTTLVSTIAGLVSARAGTIELLGESITHAAVPDRSSRGLALVQEGKRIFPELTVHQNLMLGGYLLKRPDRAAAIERAYEQFPMLKEKRGAAAGSASGGQQQMIAIAQALMTQPRVLMLDEPSAGLAPIIVDEILEVIVGLKAAGMAIILVEQLVEKSLSVADHVIALQQGRVVLDEPAEAVSATALEEAYLGAASR